MNNFFRDIVNGGACTFDPDTNLPDESEHKKHQQFTIHISYLVVISAF